ncbi:hypothetical protein T484DRAFT_1935420 [Baffinella frigidus]|nr:hypothetical protein T484DRAFT_1935420 [Cryptophyta sp. CCMP2293]
MSTTLKFVGGCAALWMLTSMPPINNIGFVASTRRAMESTGEVSFKVARGTGRAAWWASTTLFLMVYPVLYIVDPGEDPDLSALGGASVPAPLAA